MKLGLSTHSGASSCQTATRPNVGAIAISSPGFSLAPSSYPNFEEGADDSADSVVEPVTPVSCDGCSHHFTDAENTVSRSPSSTPKSPKRIPTSDPPRLSDSDTAPPTPQSRHSTRKPASRLRRTVSSLFRRSNSREFVDVPPLPPPTSQPIVFGTRGLFDGSPASSSLNNDSPLSPGSPGSPSSPVMSPTHGSPVVGGQQFPSSDDFQKKGRAATGFSLRGRAVNFVGARGRGSRHPSPTRRASSFDGLSRPLTPGLAPKSSSSATPDAARMFPPERLPWPLPPDAGTGVKARRMSLSLPDDFYIDVADLQSEYEYQHKILGRHGKHLGKGAASRVTLMVRKGCPGELYAVKEFRGKSHRESQAEYEKKIKSEFSIGKSLHHPNIVETIRLCTNHHRWNHVMEYCSEGDLFGLVQKGHLKGEDKKKDRQCLFKQLVQGVGYLHANGIAHRDIKLENLLLTKDSKLKITDFGVSEVFSGTHPGLREAGGQCGRNMGEMRLCSPGICGSEPYIAPEVLEKRDRYDARALDVWSSAIVMIYMTFGGAIWSRAERGQPHYDKLVTGWDAWNRRHPGPGAAISEDDYPKCLALDVGVNPPALRRLLLQMLNPDPRRRIAMTEVLTNRWMRNVECCQLESYDELAPTIDATKKEFANGTKKIFCHNHLPSKMAASHSLGKMPGQAGY
ncbi:kinase domain containing protein [Ophiocordyceps camponoti-floridani]|uniref:Kinase domain containing protein n=1 Tax=Ophiocordyceps camponoti-floridani TaxID=2030778 RepID=A0A8H4Q2P5_9HYPO|nr:kinase domain containing protein [Ophiocordyceps camponoti-floridani]